MVRLVRVAAVSVWSQDPLDVLRGLLEGLLKLGDVILMCVGSYG